MPSMSTRPHLILLNSLWFGCLLAHLFADIVLVICRVCNFFVFPLCIDILILNVSEFSLLSCSPLIWYITLRISIVWLG